LRLLAEASRVVEAERGLANLQVGCAVAPLAMGGKEVAKNVQRLEEHLRAEITAQDHSALKSAVRGWARRLGPGITKPLKG
jgi:uncharacterized protein with PhoU and TrkA domain